MTPKRRRIRRTGFRQAKIYTRVMSMRNLATHAVNHTGRCKNETGRFVGYREQTKVKQQELSGMLQGAFNGHNHNFSQCRFLGRYSVRFSA